MKTNKLISTITGGDESAAFMNATQVKRRLTVTVTNDLFLSLVSLCYKIGVDNFSNSITLKMINSNHSEASIKEYIGAMLKQRIKC